MALTNESFRDPRKQYTLKVRTGFYLNDREVQPGAIINVPRSVAAELMHGRKAELVTDPAQLAQPKAPAPTPQAATPVVPETPAESTKKPTSTFKEKST